MAKKFGEKRELLGIEAIAESLLGELQCSFQTGFRDEILELQPFHGFLPAPAAASTRSC